MSEKQENVGIFALELYFPKFYVDQTDLEKHDDCVGKYTIGLGLKEMAVCSTIEDPATLALTVTRNLLKKYNIDPNDVGRIDVGTESLIDKSKSIKSVIMQLFTENPDIEGADSINACYGGTAALFNALHWCSSPFNHQNKYAIMVGADLALYDPNGSTGARAAGGAGAVAILVGKNAPHIIFDPKLRASYSRHTWDFYKPYMNDPFPVVDAAMSLRCYMEAIDGCSKKLAQQSSQNSVLKEFDYHIFHSPYYKLVEKGFARLYKNDETQNYDTHVQDQNNNNEWTKAVEKQWMVKARDLFLAKVDPSLEYSQRCGNMYTPSIYAALWSLVAKVQPKNVTKVSIFSYGSGLISSMFGVELHEKPLFDTCDQFSLENLKKNAQESLEKLNTRTKVSPDDFTSIARNKSQFPGCYESPDAASIQKYLFPDTYYINEIDDQFRREYLVS